MTTNTIKNIINEELGRYGNKLNIFDFDETLVHDVATVYVIKPNGDRIPMNQLEYKKYIKMPGDKIDITEFNTVNNPTINWEIMRILKNSQLNSVILTARAFNEPIENFLKTLGIDIPVFAVGTTDPDLISVVYNARMKSQWIRNAILKFNIKEIEFWDDNGLNLHAIQEVCNELNVKVTVNKVIFTNKQ